MRAVGAQYAELLLQICHIVGTGTLGARGASGLVWGTVHALQCVALLSVLLSVPEAGPEHRAKLCSCAPGCEKLRRRP